MFDTQRVNTTIGLWNEERRTLTEWIKQDETNIFDLKQKFHNLQTDQVPLIQLRKYFSSNQRQIRRDAKDLKHEISRLDAQLQQHKDEQSNITKDVHDAKKSIADHKAFDLDDAIRMLSASRDDEKRISDDWVTRDAVRLHIENKIKLPLKEHQQKKAEYSSLEDKKTTAEGLERKLTDEANSNERRKLHQECQVKLGNDRPARVIRDCSKKQRSLSRDITKIENRIRVEQQKSERVIDRLLIDGNNVCYERQTFIQLRALSTLLKELGSRFEVTVVFDASIRSLMKTNTQGIEKIIGPDVTTHVAPTKTGADEYLLTGLCS